MRGETIGAEIDAHGEVVFNTGMSGYQEILSDPSYAGQFVTMTYTEIGNYGTNVEDMESAKLHLNGFIVHEANEPSNWRDDKDLNNFLKASNVPGIAGIDTRALTLKLRESGTLRGFMHCSDEDVPPEEAIERCKKWPGLDNQDYAAKVTCEKPYKWDEDGKLTASWGVAEELPPADLSVVVYDFGVKWNILRSLRIHGFDVDVVPAGTAAADVLAKKPDGVFFSNGPADPAAVSYAIDAAKELVGKVPIFGICLGHQILGLACGGDRYRLKFGHHGCNHPVMNLAQGTVEITSQNHNFAIKGDAMPSCLETTHVNLNDQTVEGIRHKTEPMFAVQYHPEAAPGPKDPAYLFKQFRDLVVSGKTVEA